MFGLNSIPEILNFIVQNIIWLILTVILAVIVSFIKAPIIARKLLIGNRGVIGNGLGKHFADRYIDIWYKRNIKHDRGSFYQGAANAMLSPNKSRHYQELIDRELETLKLINIRSNDRVEAKVNLRNKIIVFIVQWYLIHFIGDDKAYYKTLKAEKRKMI
ncbi:MAG: hypothetical protein WCR27_07165 [Eubacteriales bacterium]